MSAMPAGSVLVGVDGSPRAARAADWGAAEAARRGAPLHLLYAFAWLPTVRQYEIVPTAELLGSGERMITEAADRIRGGHPELAVSTEAVLGEPAVELVDRSATAAVVVLGARGLGPVTGPLLGSVSQKVAAHAHGPVVVVRAEAADPAGPVVVGLDPTSGETVLRYALEDARRRGVGVRVVHALQRGSVTGDYVDATTVRLLADLDAENEQRATDLVAEVAARFPEVPVEVRQVPGPAIEALVDAAREAVVLVVGSRGRGGLAGLLLGSVSRGVLHHAPVVAVVRVRPEARG